MTNNYFLYLHGFQGSPNSPKAQKLKAWLNDQFPEASIDAPELPMQTKAALDLTHKLLDDAVADNKVIIGSSLGGYMAHLLKQTRDDVAKVILINPAARLDLIAQMPAYSHMHDEAMALFNAMPKQLSSLSDYLLLLQEDDQTTPINLALEVFNRAQIDLKSGQGHAYSDIEVSFDAISKFLTIHSTVCDS
ncbi:MULTISPECIES: YqiA/YcfP family alpha/beta fold hydrolase [Cysteiniphilum]|uniref:YqiA/YcfP family alpha/beta fold hydrolase n=1 Tax=Cysteiniphilum TaxID=2056696 RepID=UPI0017823919|nr:MULTISPECIES: YqiA/YcfP family alpha/beta fold hydrolase [Cysteiniphilum]